jgi:thioredoxin 1
MSKETINVNDAEFKSLVLDSKEPVLVDFWAPWCAPCKAIAPTLEDLATAYKGKVKVVKLDIDDNQNTAMAYGIRSIPTLLMFKGGKVVEQLAGHTRPKIEDAFKKVI